MRQSAEDLSISLKHQHEGLLKEYSLPNDSLDMNDWEDEVTKLPKTYIGQIFSYILEMKAFSTEYVGQYKVRKAYSYFKSGFVHKIFSKSVPRGNILLFGSVTAFQRVRQPPHKVWVICKPTGEVLCGYCTCCKCTTVNVVTMLLQFCTR